MSIPSAQQLAYTHTHTHRDMPEIAVVLVKVLVLMARAPGSFGKRNLGSQKQSDNGRKLSFLLQNKREKCAQKVFIPPQKNKKKKFKESSSSDCRLSFVFCCCAPIHITWFQTVSTFRRDVGLHVAARESLRVHGFKKRKKKWRWSFGGGRTRNNEKVPLELKLK